MILLAVYRLWVLAAGKVCCAAAPQRQLLAVLTKQALVFRPGMTRASSFVCIWPTLVNPASAHVAAWSSSYADLRPQARLSFRPSLRRATKEWHGCTHVKIRHRDGGQGAGTLRRCRCSLSPCRPLGPLRHAEDSGWPCLRLEWRRQTAGTGQALSTAYPHARRFPDSCALSGQVFGAKERR